MMLRCVTLLATLAVALGAYAPDEILAMPGFSADLPSKHFSGYLNVTGTGSHLHYYLAQSESDPANSPTVFWFNGGPGCSSMDGWSYEQGPFEISKDGSTLTLRPYRWNRVVNMVFVESPVGVGFSYNDQQDYKCNDDRSAAENLGAVEAFFSMFSELKKNPFYLTGESYAGVYVPTLAEAIVKADKAGTYTGAKLSGIMVGNGCSGSKTGICAEGTQSTYFEWAYLTQTGFLDANTKATIDSECDWAKAATNDPNALSFQCMSLLSEASKQFHQINMYDIYGDCTTASCVKNGKTYGSNIDLTTGKPRGKIPMKGYLTASDPVHGTVSLGRLTPHGPDACIDSGSASAYLNRPDVMEAIHVRDPGFCWAVCNTAPGWSYKSTRENLPRDTYPLLVSNIRVLIYNGDWDACVPYTDGFSWTEGMGFKVKTPWHSWAYTSTEGNSNQVGGYAVEYDVSAQQSSSSSPTSFAFITVRGGRHEVPESAPAQAMEMLQRFLASKPF